jgi:hypothetical protein
VARSRFVRHIPPVVRRISDDQLRFVEFDPIAIDIGVSFEIDDVAGANNTLTLDWDVELSAQAVGDAQTITAGLSFEIDDSFDVTDTAAFGYRVGFAIDDQVQDAGASFSAALSFTISDSWNDSSMLSFGVGFALDESITINDTAAYSAALSFEIDDSFETQVVNGQRVNNAFDGYSLTINAMTGAASVYANWEFDSFMQVAGTHYAIDSSALYTLGGSDDDGAEIAAEWRTGLMDFGTPQMKRTDLIVLGGTSAAEMQVTVYTHEGNDLVGYTYDTHRLADAPSELHAEPGKGMKSRYVQYGFSNQAGADFEIDRVDIFALALSRRR